MHSSSVGPIENPGLSIFAGTPHRTGRVIVDRATIAVALSNVEARRNRPRPRSSPTEASHKLCRFDLELDSQRLTRACAIEIQCQRGDARFVILI